MQRIVIAGKALLLLSLICTALTAFAQNGSDRKEMENWQVYTAPSKTFSVNLPYLPKIHSLSPTKEDPEPSFGDVEWLEFFNGEYRAKSVSIYVPPAEGTPLTIFEAEIDSSKRNPKTLDDDVFGLLLMFGGDDNKVLIKNSTSINGHKALDVVYRHPFGSELYGRLLAVELPGRVVVMVYSRAIGNLQDEERIFKSFKILVP